MKIKNPSILLQKDELPFGIVAGTFTLASDSNVYTLELPFAIPMYNLMNYHVWTEEFDKIKDSGNSAAVFESGTMYSSAYAYDATNYRWYVNSIKWNGSAVGSNSAWFDKPTTQNFQIATAGGQQFIAGAEYKYAIVYRKEA